MRSKHRKETTNLWRVYLVLKVCFVFSYFHLCYNQQNVLQAFRYLPFLNYQSRINFCLSYFLGKVHTQTNATESLHTYLKPAWKQKMTELILVIFWRFWWCPNSLMPLLVGVSCKTFGHWVVRARHTSLNHICGQRHPPETLPHRTVPAVRVEGPTRPRTHMIKKGRWL